MSTSQCSVQIDNRAKNCVPMFIILGLLFFMAGSIAMVIIAVKNPPEIIRRVDEWK